jgi:hypothetical protein
MSEAPVRGRIGTILAVGFLTLDGVLLVGAGLWGRQAGPAIGGLVCLALAGTVLVFWRRHRRTVAELPAARQAVRDEVRALRDLLRR